MADENDLQEPQADTETTVPEPDTAIAEPQRLSPLPAAGVHEMTAAPVNPFDKFDVPKVRGPQQPKTGNPFDAFDSPQDRAIKRGLDGLPEFSVLKQAYQGQQIDRDIQDAIGRDALASEARRSAATLDPDGQKFWVDNEIASANAEREKWQGELTRLADEHGGLENVPPSLNLPGIMDALQSAQSRHTLAKQMQEDQRLGIQRTHSLPMQAATAQAIEDQAKRVAYQQEVLSQVIATPGADPIAIENAKSNVAFERAKLEKLRNYQEGGQQRPAVKDATGTGELVRQFTVGSMATVPEMLGGAAIRYGQDIGGGTGEAMETLGNMVRDFGRSARRDTPAEASPNLLDLDWQKQGFFNDLKLYMAAKIGQGLGTSAPVIGAAIAGGGVPAMGIGVAMGQGQMQNALEEAFAVQGVDIPPDKVATYVYLYGTAIGALESVTELWALSGLSKEIATKSLASSLAKGVAKGAAIEGVTEGLQEILEIHGVSAATGKAIDWQEARRRVIEATVAGAIPGAALGGITAKKGSKASEPPGIEPKTDTPATPAAPLATEPTQQAPVEAPPAPQEAATEAKPAEGQKTGDTTAEAAPVTASEPVAPVEVPKPNPEAQTALSSYLSEGGTLSKADMPALAERLGVAPEELPKVLDQAVEDGTLRKTAGGMYRRAVEQTQAKLGTPEAARAAVQQAISEIGHVLPKGVGVRVFDTAAQLPDGIRQDVQDIEASSRSQVDAAVHDDYSDIFLASHALNPAGTIGHEGVHILKNRGLITDAELSLLADRAAKIPDLFDRAAYEKAYASRPNAQALLAEEAAAHLIEARINGQDFGRQINTILDRIVQFFERLRNALAGKGFQTADDVVKAFMSGEMAQRGEAAPDIASEAMFALRDAQTGQDMRRDLDSLGYYSKALEAAKALKQAKGTPEQMLAQLKAAGVKEAEIKATGLDAFLEGQKSVTRDEIVKHLTENRVGLTEVVYGGQTEAQKVQFDDAAHELAVHLQKIGNSEAVVDEMLFHIGDRSEGGTSKPPRMVIDDRGFELYQNLIDVARVYPESKWNNYSLDKENPTYRETVLHLPARGGPEFVQNTAGDWGNTGSAAERSRSGDMMRNPDYDRLNVVTGHFSEPNIIGHMMTSMTTHEGKPVFTIDQIQSDWGQKLRDGGVRDEAKIDGLRAQIDSLKSELESMPNRWVKASDELRYRIGEISSPEAHRIEEKIELLKAELRTAERSASGHPLVNTTDQWTTTTLRRAVRQAAEADADYIAIPSGDTVLSYNPGDEHGMGEFYNKIVPKNLRNILQKIDKDSPPPQRIDTLDSPSGKTGLGKGFTLFPLTDKVKQSVRGDGQAMFALAPAVRRSSDAENLLSQYRSGGDEALLKAIAARYKTVADILDTPEFADIKWDGKPLNQVIAETVRHWARSGDTGIEDAQVVYALRDRLGLSRTDPQLQSMNTLVRDLAADLGIVVRRGFKTTASKTAKVAGTRAGVEINAYYDPTSGVLRLRKFNDVAAFSEAAGNILAQRFGKIFQSAVDRVNQSIQNDLNDLAFEKHNIPLRENNLEAMRAELDAIRKQGFIKDSAETQARGATLARDIPRREAELATARRRIATLEAKTRDAAVMPSDMGAWFSTYLMNPTSAATDPFTDVFEAALDAADPTMLAKIESAQQAISAYAKANPSEVMRSIVVPSTKDSAWDRLHKDAQRFGWRMAMGLRQSDFYANVWANDHPLFIATRDLLLINAANTGKKLDLKAVENPAKLWRLAAQARAKATRDLDKGIRLADQMDNSGPSMSDVLTTALGPNRREAVDTGPGSRYRDFGAYLMSRMGVERWTNYENAVASDSGNANGLREPYAVPKSVMVAAIHDLEAKYPTFMAAAEQLYQFQNNLLTLQWQKGLITDEQYQALSQEKNYVPSLRSFEDEQQLSGGTGKKGEAAKADIIKRFRGSQRDVIDPIASIALKVFKARADIAVNDSLKQLLHLAESVGPGGGLIAERLDARQAQAFEVDLKSALRNAAKEANLSENDRAALVDLASEMLGSNVTTTVFSQGKLTGGKGEPIVWIKEKGKAVPVRLGKMGEGGAASARLGQQIWDMLNTFGETHTNWVVNMMALPAQMVRSAVVSHPSFMLANIIRDAPAAWGYDPKALPLWTQIKGAYDVARGAEYVERYRTHAGMMGGEATQLFDDFLADHDVETLVRKGYRFKVFDSVGNAVSFLTDAFSTRNWPDKAFGAAVGGIAGFGVAGPAGMAVGAGLGATIGGKTIAAVGELSETATRAQLWKHAYERAVKSGLSDVEAAAEAAVWAHDYGDYSRHGLKTDVFRRWVPFLNANLQANDSFARRLLAKGDYGFENTKYLPGYLALWPLYKAGVLQLPATLTNRQREEIAMSAWTWFQTMAVIGSASLVYALLYRDDDRIKMLPDSLRANHWNIPLDDLARAIGMELPKEHRGKHFARIPKPFERAIVANTVERLAMEYARGNPRWLEHWLQDAYEVTKPPLMPTMFDIPAQILMNRDSFSGREIVPRMGPGGRSRPEMFDEYTSQFARWLGQKLDLAPQQVDFFIAKLGSTWGRDATRANIPGAPWYDPKAPAQGLDEKFIASRFLYKIGKGTEAEKAYREVMGGESTNPLGAVWDRIAQPYNHLDARAESYKFYKNTLHQDANAFAKLDGMTPEERGYALLEGHWEGQNAKYQQLHPMKRAETVAKLVSQMQKELLGDHATAGKKGPRQTMMDLSPTEKAAARDVLTQFKAMEVFNALVLTGEKGWQNRGYLPAQSVLDELKTAVPEIHAEFTRRLEKAHVLPFEGVKTTWPRVKSVLEGPELLRRVKDKDTVGIGALLAPEYSEAKFTR